MTSPNGNEAFAATLVDQWASSGLAHVVLAPGSRSAPLALAAARHPRVTAHVVPDERSAAFFALGVAKVTGRPAAVVCTSGTAATNFHPAVVEAHHSRTPLLVLTADRPPELRGVGAPQTIDQLDLYGGAVRWFADAEPPEIELVPGRGGAEWRALAVRALAAATGRPAGPVHLNLPFREPLTSPVPARPIGAPLSPTDPPRAEIDDHGAALLADLARVGRGVVVVGWGAQLSPSDLEVFAAATGWPVLADAISGSAATSSAIGAYDALARIDRFRARHRPQVVVRVGAPPTSKALGQWLADLAPDVPQVLVDPDGIWLDPHGVVTHRVTGEPSALLAGAASSLEGAATPAEWLRSWQQADLAARTAIDLALDEGACDEARVARDLVACAPPGSILAVASSMPVRDVETFAAARHDVTYLSNRGVNGIDGFVSTALGAAAGTGRSVLALLGDLCFLHDVGGLRAAPGRAVDGVLVVVDNDGGGIFSFLPQADHTERDEFDALFGAPHGLDLVAVAHAHGVGAQRVEPGGVAHAVGEARAAGGVHVVVVPSEREANVEGHRHVQERVVAAVADVTAAGR